jgi:hypothetical protein
MLNLGLKSKWTGSATGNPTTSEQSSVCHRREIGVLEEALRALQRRNVTILTKLTLIVYLSTK